MTSTPYVIDHTQARELLARIDVPQILRKLFRDLAAGHAVQPAQQLVEFPQGAGDFINYLGCWPRTVCTGSRPRRTSSANKGRW